MNANIKTSFLLMFIGIAMGGCNNEADYNNSGQSDDNLIRVLPQINNTHTRTGWDNSNLEQNSQQFGLFIHPQLENTKPENIYNNVRMVYKNSAWNDYAPGDVDATTPLRQMHWSTNKSNVKVTAYLPYRQDVSTLTTINGKIGVDQNADPQGASVNANDFLYFQGMVNPTATADKVDSEGNITEYKLIDGKIAVPFRHKASKLNLKFTIGTSFNIPPSSTETNPITLLKVNGTVCDYDFNLATGALSSSTGAAAASIAPWFNTATYTPGNTYISKAMAQYECILVPQTLAANAFSISLTIGTKKFEWASEIPVSLLAGKQHNLTLNVGDNTISLSDYTIDDWGTANVPVEPDVTTSVAINEELCSAGELVDLSTADRRIHFINQGGVATLAFTGDYDKGFEIIGADPRLSIVPSTETTFKNSTINIKAVENTKGEAYTTRFRIFNPQLITDKGVEITINVDAYMASVEMGGFTWMQFNGVGRDPELYYYPNMTAREVYKKDWPKFAVTSMWGPRKTLSPMLLPQDITLAYNNDETINASTPDWTSEYTNIPCPEGWRLPTYAEFGNIWPSNYMEIPATYTRNNVTYTATVINSGYPTIELSKTTKFKDIPTDLLVISDGKNELLFPMSGWRTRIDSWTPDFKVPATDAGQSFYLWTQNRGAEPRDAQVVGINYNRGYSGYYNTNGGVLANAEGYQSVRCIKNK